MNRLFIFGLGYSARAIGHLFLEAGWQVSGTIRPAAKLASLKEEGFTPVLFSDKPSVEAALKTATHCLVSIPPDERGIPLWRPTVKGCFKHVGSGGWVIFQR